MTDCFLKLSSCQTNPESNIPKATDLKTAIQSDIQKWLKSQKEVFDENSQTHSWEDAWQDPQITRFIIVEKLQGLKRFLVFPLWRTDYDKWHHSEKPLVLLVKTRVTRCYLQQRRWTGLWTEGQEKYMRHMKETLDRIYEDKHLKINTTRAVSGQNREFYQTWPL